MIDLRRIITDLAAWESLAATIVEVSLPANRASLDHRTGTQADSQVERATHTRQQLASDIQAIEAAAYSTGWRGHTLDGDKYAWLASRADWGPRNGPDWNTHTRRLEAIHSRWKTLCNPDSEQSNHTCPLCLTARLVWHYATRTYRCLACDYAGTPSQIRNMQRWRIVNEDWYVSRDDACHLLGITRSALRARIHRGTISETGGLIHTSQLRGQPYTPRD